MKYKKKTRLSDPKWERKFQINFNTSIKQLKRTSGKKTKN